MRASTLNRKLKRSRAKALALEPELVAAYEKQILKAGNGIARRFAQQASSHLPQHAMAADGEPPADWTPPPEGDILGGESAAAAKAVRPMQERVLREAVGGALLGISFDLKAPVAQRLLDMLGRRAGDIEAGLREPVARSIAESYEAGATIPEAAEAIRAVTSGLAGWQATMLARTDLISLANGGSDIAVAAVNEEATAADEPTFEVKTWLATMDDRTRDTHAEADGQEVPIDQQFQVGEDWLDYPGDPNGSDAEVINCRCTALYSEVTAAEAEDALAASADTLGGTVKTDSAANAPNALTSAVTITIGDAEVEAAEFAPVPWRAVLALEGTPTIDGRFFPVDSLTWRELPLSLLAQTETQPGHDGAEVCGRIDRIWREAQADGTTHIMGEGEFTGEEGAEIAPMVADETLRGLSIDVAVSDTGLRDPVTGEIINVEDLTEDDFFDMMFGVSKYQTVMFGGVIGAATVCAFPAFDDATIAVVASGARTVAIHTLISLADPEALTAAAAGMAPEHPPRDWFTDPGLDRLTALTVTDEGRVVGHLAGWDTCHIGSPGGPGTCTVAPDSKADYRYFHLGALETAEGDEISVGQITLDTGHAGLNANRAATLRHYDHTGTAVADVRAGEDAFGIWVAGAVRPDITPNAVRKLRAASLSGDWRSIDSHLELVAALCVNVPGFPIPRAQAAVAASGVTAMVAAGVIVAADEFDTVKCSNCGAMNDATAQVCADCGQSLPGAMSAEEFLTRLEAMAALVGVE